MATDPLEASMITGSKITFAADGKIIEVSDANLDARELMKVVITLWVGSHANIVATKDVADVEHKDKDVEDGGYA